MSSLGDGTATVLLQQSLCPIATHYRFGSTVVSQVSECPWTLKQFWPAQILYMGAYPGVGACLGHCGNFLLLHCSCALMVATVYPTGGERAEDEAWTTHHRYLTGGFSRLHACTKSYP